MTCDKCEKKLGKIITNDPLCHKAHNSNTSGSGPSSRKVGGNKLLEKRSDRYDPSRKLNKNVHYRRCKICDQIVHQKHFRYCHKCSVMKGICSICGKRMINFDRRKLYKMTYK